jgi:mRNA interferase HigB
VRVIAIKNLRDFWEIHPDAEVSLKAWLEEAKAASWKSPADIKARYANVSILKSRRVVFNIKGNDYRLIAAVAYQFAAVYIKFVGTHKQYDSINADTVEIQS